MSEFVGILAMSEEVSELDSTENPVLKRKEKKHGIIYLSYIPRYMNVVKVREYFSDFGEVRRIYLKPDRPPKKGKPSKFFSEGWVEFASRKMAKRVAESLNNSQVGGKRNTPYFDALWSIRYLPKFQWSQLHEREAYRKAEARQRMRAEIAQTKREINFYSRAVDMEKRRKKRDRDCENKIEMDNLQLPLQAELLEISPEDNKDDRNKNIAKSFFI